MPYQTGQTCVETAQQAVDYLASSHVGELVTLGGSQYVVSVVSTSPFSITYRYQDVSTTTSLQKDFPVSPMPCSSMSTADAVTLAWLVATAWLCAYCIKLLMHHFQNPTGETNDA